MGIRHSLENITEPVEQQNRTPDPAAPSDLVLLLGTNRMRPG